MTTVDGVDLHIDYETADPYPLEEFVAPAAELDDHELFAVTDKKMKFRSKTDRSTLIFSPRVTLRGIPGIAHEYRLGSRSALERFVDRHYIKTDKASGIVNDPNAWYREQENPRYIVDLVKRVVTGPVETMKIIGTQPDLSPAFRWEES